MKNHYTVVVKEKHCERVFLVEASTLFDACYEANKLVNHDSEEIISISKRIAK